MINKFLIALFTLTFSSCQTSLIKSASKFDSDDYIVKIEQISLNSNRSDIIRLFGETKDMGINKENGHLALGFPDSNSKRRYSFFFNKSDNKLILKTVHIIAEEPASFLDFWKAKFPKGNFEIKTETIHHGHVTTYDEWIEVTKMVTLTIKKNKVTQASWSN